MPKFELSDEELEIADIAACLAAMGLKGTHGELTRLAIRIYASKVAEATSVETTSYIAGFVAGIKFQQREALDNA